MKKALPIFLILVLAALSTAAQKQQLTSKMVYHNGPLLTGIQNVYVVYYGCWTDNCGRSGDTKTMNILTDVLISIGNTPYAQINSTYTDASGHPAASGFIFGGYVVDASYSHGTDLTQSDMVDLISYQVNNFQLPQDPNGIYVIVSSADIASTATGSCSPSAPPFHG
jgi:Phosphate-induced protein 1 conserved region